MVSRIRSDSGLMGPTHALSAMALTFLVAWLFPKFFFEGMLGSYSYVVFISAVIIIVGAALMPDLDAVQSTSINTLGPIGKVLSSVMRGFSSIVQSTINAKADEGNRDPHRGFWHTIISGLMIGFLVVYITKIDTKIFSVGEKEITVAKFIVVFIIYISTQLFMASLLKKFYKKTKNSLTGTLAMNIVSVVVAVFLLAMLPSELNYNWVGIAVAFGWILHLLGDSMTVAGVPLFFPFKYKGKRWWNYRLPFAIKAGGFIEMSILIPIFLLIAIISLVGVIPMLQ